MKKILNMLEIDFSSVGSKQILETLLRAIITKTPTSPQPNPFWVEEKISNLYNFIRRTHFLNFLKINLRA